MTRARIVTLGGDGERGRPRVCLYSMHIVNLYRTRPVGSIGGAEVQYSLLARELAKTHDVHVVTLAPVPADEVTPPPGHTLHLLDVPRGRSGTLWALRVILAQWRAFGRADPAAVLQRGAGLATFAVALWCRLRRRAFVFHWASDANARGPVASEGPGVATLYRLGRRLADLQVCQTEHQKGLLPPAERRRAVVIPNVLDDRVGWRPSPRPGQEVLWVGTIRPESKRPDLFLDLAEALPHRRFRMVGEMRGDPAFQAAFKQRLATLPNVQWVGFQTRAALPRHFAAARCLVNTSDFEGFPNTFLEACASGVPVVSRRIDPGGLLERRGAGLVAHDDPHALRDHVEAMFDDDAWRRHHGFALAALEAHRAPAAAERLRGAMAAMTTGG